MPTTAPRILFLGLDGGTRVVFDPLFDRGWMPRLESFWRRSARGNLRSTTPMVTPVAWTSFLTGCTPVRHGIHDFCWYDARTRTVGFNHAERVAVPTLWHLLDRLDRPVVSLNLPMTYPAPRIQGIVVSGAESPDRSAAFRQCPDFGRELACLVPEYSPKNIWKRRPRTLEDLRGLARLTREIFLAQARAAERADAQVDWSVLMVHFHLLDGLQHRVWPEMGLDPDVRPRTEWSAEVEGCFRALDEAVGRLLELAARRNAAIVAVSDHGFGPCRALVSVNGLLERGGYQRRLRYGTRFRYRYHRLRHRYARWRLRNNPEAAAALPRPVAGEVGCDWRHTTAFAPFGQLAALVCVEPGRTQRSRLAAEVAAYLADCRDPETGSRLFADAFPVAERYGLDPAEHGLPDVLAPSADGYQAQAKWSPFDDRWFASDPDLPATHTQYGIVAIDAPGIGAGDRLAGELPDVAPTALALLGIDAPEYMEGRSLIPEDRVPSARPRRDGHAAAYPHHVR
ncbi:MAG: hypothetical protein KatS3mg108_1312 [Isosphaeraceae bacterium]|jgi:predicted AlkP superfamily phosphohydrolase/phosphomutase|nr:MAG: hypothetical protein KatS3mg108_1312 [Isosphaeraceae bacterium]